MTTTDARRTISKGLTIAVDDINYHRNGVGGVGFSVVKFRVTKGPGARSVPPLLGVVFDSREEAQPGGRIAVISQSLDLQERWRGFDDWGAELLTVVERWLDLGLPRLQREAQ